MTDTPLSRKANIVSWIAQLVAAGILAMAGIMKLTGQPDSIALFQRLTAEPWGRYLVGLMEITAVVLLLRPRTAGYGGLLGMVVAFGALGTHLTMIGITYGGDPSLFIMAAIVMLAAVAVVTIRQPRIFGLGGRH